jgi:zinc metalloprotease ZmpB
MGVDTIRHTYADRFPRLHRSPKFPDPRAPFVNARKHTGTSLAFAIGLALSVQADLHAAKPGEIIVLRSGPGVQDGARFPVKMTTDGLTWSGRETPVTRASKLLSLNRRVLGIDSLEFDFVPAATSEVPGGSHVRFTQRYRGVEVHRGELVVSMDRRGSLTMVADAHIPRISVDRITPALSAAEALKRAAAAIGTSSQPIGAPDRADLVIARGQDRKDRLVYRVSMTREQPAGDWEVLVDAATGDIHGIEDRFVQHHGGIHVQGQGMTYLSDPLGAARAVYGSPGFIDGGDADTDSLHAYRAPVRLDSLVVENGLAWLRGPYCSVADIEAPYDSVDFVQPPPYRFDYDRSQPGFEAVMVYYHATQSLLRFESLGFFLSRLRSLRLDPHGFQGKDNSHYSPSGNWISFGTGGVDDAEDADVIWHEYGHAIHYTIVPGWGGGDCAALGEGYGDYWAGSYARSLDQWGVNDPQHAWTFKWDGHNEFWEGRILNDARRYPFDGLSPHTAGQIWASALMDIHDQVGRDVADRLVLKSLYYLSNGISARDAAYALLQADIDLYDGSHLGLLHRVLGTERGFLPPESGSTILVLSDAGPGASGDASSAVSGAGALGVLASMHVPSGYAVHVADWATFEPRAFLDAAVAVVLSGGNPNPLDNETRRRSLSDFVRAGGRVILEGSEVAGRMLSSDIEPEFARDVLAIEGVTGPLHCTSLRATTDLLFTAPNPLPSVLAFQPRADTSARSGVRPIVGHSEIAAAALWNDPESPAGIVTRSAPEGGLRSIFFSFAIGTMADSTEGAGLLENAVFTLLGEKSTTPVENDPGALPDRARLRQNYPNPFNPSTTIQFTLALPQRAVIRVYDLLGREVALLMDETRAAGTYEVDWNANGMPSGVYLCQLTAGGSVHTTRMVLMK